MKTTTESLQAELDEAKRHLYHLLLQKPPKDWTDAEAQIGFELMKDASIQRRLDGEKA